MLEIIIIILIAISGICWSIVYIDSIRIGFKQKTYCMPLFALGLNIAWEGIYAYTDLFIRNNIGVQAIANTIWFLLDFFIVVTFIKFGKDELESELEKKWFIPWTLLVMVCCFIIQILFIVEFGNIEGEKYSAYLQNIAMSIAYIYMLNRRKSSKGQTITIAVCKCIGTVTPTIYGALEGNIFIVVTGIICFIFDIIYIYFLSQVKQKEKYALLTTS